MSHSGPVPLLCFAWYECQLGTLLGLASFLAWHGITLVLLYSFVQSLAVLIISITSIYN